MNKIIYPIRLSTPEETKKAIQRLVQQLKRDNIAICPHPNAVRLFSRNIPKCYKNNEVILISKTVGMPKSKTKNIIYLKPEYTLKINDDFSFRITTKHK
jgi:hypothetical protein